MNTLAIAILAAVPVIAIVGSIVFMVYKHSKGMSTKRAFKMQIATFGAIVVMATIFAFTASAANDDTAAANDAAPSTSVSEQQQADTASADSGLASGLKYLSAALSIGIAAMSENPKTFGKSIVLLALGEAVALYGLVIAFMILLGIGG